jgi:hypothetical protein
MDGLHLASQLAQQHGDDEAAGAVHAVIGHLEAPLADAIGVDEVLCTA